jgi:hypothetical protein
MVDDQGYDDRATVVPVRVGSRTGPGWIVAVTATAVAVVTFAFGYRLGNAPPAPSPTPRPTLAATIPPPDPTASALPSPDIAAGVSRRLRGAVSAAGGPIIGTWVICEVGDALHCRPLDHQSLGRDFSTVPFRFSEAEWAKVLPETVQPGQILVAAPLGGEAAAGTLALLSPAFDPLGSLTLTPVNADLQGVYFMDLGPLEPGQYVVAVGNLKESGFADGLGPTFAWASYYAGIEVAPLAVP